MYACFTIKLNINIKVYHLNIFVTFLFPIILYKNMWITILEEIHFETLYFLFYFNIF